MAGIGALRTTWRPLIIAEKAFNYEPLWLVRLYFDASDDLGQLKPSGSQQPSGNALVLLDSLPLSTRGVVKYSLTNRKSIIITPFCQLTDVAYVVLSVLFYLL